MNIFYSLKYCMGANGDNTFTGSVGLSECKDGSDLSESDGYIITSKEPLVIKSVQSNNPSATLSSYFSEKHNVPVDNVYCTKLSYMSPEEEKKVTGASPAFE